LAVFRFLLGLGMGGEWTSGAALVSETWPDAHRGKAMGLMQCAWSVGYAAAAVVVAVVLPRFGWRAVFFIGILPAFVALWIRRGIEESPEWIRSRSAQHDRVTPLRAIFAADYLRFTLLLTALSTASIFAYWGLNLWVPAYLSLPPSEGGAGFGTGVATSLVVLIQFGAFLGYISFGWVADAFGRRRSFLVYLLTAAVLVLGFGQTHNPLVLAFLGPLTTFFGTGFFSGFGAVTAEFYPTAIRATAQGFTYNLGRVASAAAPWLVGGFAKTHGFPAAITIAALAYLLAAACWAFIPETKGRAITS